MENTMRKRRASRSDVSSSASMARKRAKALESWAPDSWKAKPAHQLPEYPNQSELDEALNKVKSLPPLVHPGEIERLKREISRAQQGDAFLLQGGDCAERFLDCAQQPIEDKMKILIQMSLVLIWGARIPVIRVARIAGQYAKPRSKPTEMVNGKEVFSFKGDIINGIEPENRKPDPHRLVEAYFHSASTLNYIRSLVEGGFADLHNPDQWSFQFCKNTKNRLEYEKMTSQLLDAMKFLDTAGISSSVLDRVNLYTSHEGMHLPYEEAHTRKVGTQYYNQGAHFLWIGDRTRQPDCAHVEYCRGISNPVGIKVGPATDPASLVDVIKRLNPTNEPGKITLITRLGAGSVRDKLPQHIRAINDADLVVLWSCDPMHGNTFTSQNGLKTREFSTIMKEIIETFCVHEEEGTHLGGMHLEMTGEHVTECVGGPQELAEEELPLNYVTYCDPRLNYAQALEVAFLVAKHVKDDDVNSTPAASPQNE